MKEDKVIYKELSYKVIGVLFDVYNEIGGKHYEKYIQNAIAFEFDQRGIRYIRENKTPLYYKSKIVGNYYPDFIVEEKIVLEIKRSWKFDKQDFKQIEAYLKAKKLKLGLLVLFTATEVKFVRVLNLY